jgi:aminopeptidase N
MTEDTTTNDQEVVAESDEGDINAPAELRAAYKREKAENKKLKAQLMDNAYRQAGLDTSGGLGKAIARLYEGEPDAEAILAYAKEEFGYEQASAPENPAQPVIQQQQATLDAINQVGTPVNPQTEIEALIEAEKSGDFATAGAIKAEQLKRLFGP